MGYLLLLMLGGFLPKFSIETKKAKNWIADWAKFYFLIEQVNIPRRGKVEVAPGKGLEIVSWKEREREMGFMKLSTCLWELAGNPPHWFPVAS